MKLNWVIFGFSGWLLSGAVWAQTLVLIPGFQEQGMDWRLHHVTSALESSGWVDGGNLQWTPQGVLSPVSWPQRPENVFYTLDLPTKAPIEAQAQILDQYLHRLQVVRKEPLSLVGHSAGGVVARYWLVATHRVPVNALVSIATPHLGTPMADLSEALSNTPLLAMVKELGFELPDSDALYTQLAEEKPGRFLYWLNHQRHPVIRYVSVVRTNKRPENLDFVVPPHSQDMNNIFVLRGHSEIWESGGGHFLGAEDGYRLAAIFGGDEAARR